MSLSFYLWETLQKKSNPSPNREIIENEKEMKLKKVTAYWC